MKAIRHALLATPGEDARPVDVLVADSGLIDSIVEAGSAPPDHDTLADGGGVLRVFPGFIDIHTHGAAGADLSQGTPEAVRTFAEAKLAEGVTTFLPTTWTATAENLLAMARAAADYRSDQIFARAPCLHVEGPYLNPDQAGAQDPNCMRLPDPSEIEKLHAICPVGLVSLAIELDGALDFVHAMKKLGIVTSAAHSAATHRDFLRAREVGLGHLTHYCNQMSRLHHREIGLVGSALLDDEVMIEMICDRIHLCPEMIQLVFKHRSPERLMLITDSIAASHLGDGTYPLGDTEITVRDGAARIPEGNLAGSIALFNEVVKNAAEISGLPPGEIARCAATNQARALGFTDRGAVREGLLADLTLLDSDFQVHATFVGGEERYHRN